MENPYRQYMYSYPHKTAYGTLRDIRLEDYVGRLQGGDNSLYFHIPFCQYKCGYCNLFSVTGQPEQLMWDYVDAMERHAGQLSEVLPEYVKFADLTLGGGTPLMLPEPLLCRVFELAREYFGFEADGHFVVVETSPNQTTENKLSILKDEGVDRVSIGVQSFQEEELAVLHRFHTVETARKALSSIKQKGFSCLNIDLIYGIPGQTAESLLDSLKQALEYEPEELFVYPLYVKPQTFLHRQGIQPSKDAFEMYFHVRDFLQSEGYQPYSMRRFVKGRSTDGISCGFGNTISLGCGGRSYIDNLHFCSLYAVKQEHCLSILKEYIEQQDYLQINHGYVLSVEEQKRRYVIRHILFGMGINRQEYRENFGGEADRDFPVLKEWVEAGYAMTGDAWITLTDKGFALSDYLGPQLISQEVRQRMEGRR